MPEALLFRGIWVAIEKELFNCSKIYKMTLKICRIMYENFVRIIPTIKKI
jgi:hypothetical protein